MSDNDKVVLSKTSMQYSLSENLADHFLQKTLPATASNGEISMLGSHEALRMGDNNAFLRLLAAAQATNSTPNKTSQPKGQTDAMMWQQVLAVQAQMMAYQQLQQQQGLGEIFKQLNQLTARSTKKENPKPANGATATIKEGAEIHLEAGEVPKIKSATPAKQNNVLENAMWQMLAASMLQQQSMLTKSGTKKDQNGVLDLSHKKEASTSLEGAETRCTTTPHDVEQGKKRAPPTEKAARLPLQLGWKRQTCIRALTASGIRGDVVYYAPCGKKLSSYAEVIRYLMKNPCSTITRDNFSFSSKLLIGEFIYPKEATDGEKIILKLTEVDVTEQINLLISQKPLPKERVERKPRETTWSATSEDVHDLYDQSELKTHDEEEKKWSREPVDDLLLTEIRTLPELTRLPNLKLGGNAFADALMVFEFCQNFAEVLSIKRESLPSLEELVSGLDGDVQNVLKVLELTKTLFTLTLEYPGLPSGKRGQTVLGQSVADIGMCRENYSELMRQFLQSRCSQGQTLAKLLEFQSFEVLSGEQKVSILAFFCNELVCCRNVVREIDTSLEEIAKLKGERWLRDGKARALRAQQKRKKKEEKKEHHDEEGDVENNSDSEGSRPGSPAPKKLTPGLGQVEILSDIEISMSVEQLDEEISHLKIESEGMKKQINEIACRVRSYPFGWDRYHRQYWQLPHVSTVLVESIESSGPYNPACNAAEICPKDPQPYSTPTFTDPDVFAVVEDLVDDVVLMRIAGDKRKRKKVRRIDNGCKRGWWTVTSKEQLEAVRSSLHGRGIRERCLHRLLCKSWFLKDVRCVPMELTPVAEEISTATIVAQTLNGVRDVLSSLEQRIADALLGPQGYVAPPASFQFGDPIKWDYSRGADLSSPSLDELKQRLLDCEQLVDRRYLRQNFFGGSAPSIRQLLGLTEEKPKEGEAQKDEEVEDEEKDKTEEEGEKVELLDEWKVYIGEAKTSAQLMLAVQCLDSSIAWERSISEACCQICRTSNKPEDLLLCDGCQMGYHMRCFKPKMESVPEGNWYCPRCREQARGKPICVLCQSEGAPIFPCKKCYNFLHLECSGQHVPESHSEYFCPACEPKHLERRVIMRGESEERGNVDETVDSEVKDFRRGTKRKAEPLAPVSFPTHMSMDLCRTMLDELEQQPSVGPFLEPVDTELVPSYKEVIMNPIDISTIRNKVDSECYDTPEDFASDLELMFNNCRTFNEDDSPVGIAGHTLHKFFTKRFRQVKYNYSKRLRRIKPN